MMQTVSSTRPPLDGWRPYAWLAAMVLVLYARCLRFGPINMDDNFYLQYKFDVLADWSNIPQLFHTDAFLGSAGHFYRPLLVLTFMLDAHLWGRSLELWHSSNIAFHLASSLLVFSVLSRICRRAPAFLLSAVFAVHPALASSVAWIPCRNDSLLAVWVLSAFICFQTAFKTGKLRWILAHLFFLAGAFLTKELAVSVPFVCLGYAFLVERSPLPRPCRTALLLGWAIEITGWSLLRRLVLHPLHDYSLLGASRSALHEAPALLLYWGKALLPFGLSPYPVLRDASLAWGALAALAAAIALLRQRRGGDGVALWGIGWFVVFLLPSFVYPDSHLQPVHFEHRLYLPLVGVMAAISRLDFMVDFDAGRRKQLLCAAAVIAGLAGLCWDNAAWYRDDIAPWVRAAQYSPSSAAVHVQLGSAYSARSHFPRAEAEYQEAIALEPRMSDANDDLGLLYLREGRRDEARLQFSRALETRPDDPTARWNLDALGLSKKN